MNDLNHIAIKRRYFLQGAAITSISLGLGACATPPSAPSSSSQIPIVFVHGNGDTAGLWIAQFWRFESNGYERRLLHAIDFKNPLARSDDSKPQETRSGTEEARAELAAFVATVLAQTGATKVALVGSSRGCNTIRNFIKSGGAAQVSHVVLCGGVNHGVFAMDANLVSEFNGKGAFMQRLNAPEANGNEVAPGIKWMTIRSDAYDKFAQPDGRYIGQPGVKTNIDFTGPALKGADDVVLTGADHREVAFNANAFAEMYRHIVGKPPATLATNLEEPLQLSGKVTGFAAGVQTNLPLVGARLQVYAVDRATGKRTPSVLLDKVIAQDGLWGPISTKYDQALEFVVSAAGYPTTHIYRAPFHRSSNIVHLRPAPQSTLADIAKARAPSAGTAGAATPASWVTITRPRGYLGQGRDTFGVDNQRRAINDFGVPAESTQRFDVAVNATAQAIFNTERIAVQTWPLADNHVVLAEFQF